MDNNSNPRVDHGGSRHVLSEDEQKLGLHDAANSKRVVMSKSAQPDAARKLLTIVQDINDHIGDVTEKHNENLLNGISILDVIKVAWMRGPPKDAALRAEMQTQVREQVAQGRYYLNALLIVLKHRNAMMQALMEEARTLGAVGLPSREALAEATADSERRGGEEVEQTDAEFVEALRVICGDGDGADGNAESAH